jgi:chromosome segregation ATPase
MITTKALFASEELDDRSLEFLSQALEQNNLPGFDYLEYKKAITALLAINQGDLAAAHQNAFATASVMGLTKAKLLETAAYYRNLLEREKAKFDEALETQTQLRVHSKTADIHRLQDQIARHQAEINRLQEEIVQYTDRKQAAETSLQQEQEKLHKTHSNFEKTHAALLLQLDRDIEQIHQYLPNQQ